MGVTDITSWPVIFDAADVGGALIPAIPFSWTKQRIALGTVLWAAKDAAAGDVVILQDQDGDEIWRSQAATGANFADEYKFPDSVSINGLVVAALPHGILEFYYR